MPIADVDQSGRGEFDAPSLVKVLIAAAPWLVAAVVAVLALM